MKNRAIINDFSVINNKVSEFLYEAIDKVQGFGIKKENFLKIIGHRMGKQIIPKLQRSYQKLRDTVNNHREMESRKQKTRLDYVGP